MLGPVSRDHTFIVFWKKGLQGKPGMKGDKGEAGRDVSAEPSS